MRNIARGGAAVGIGSSFGSSPLRVIGGTFFMVYCIEKRFAVPAGSFMGYATIGLFVAIMVGGTTWWSQNHMDIVRPFLLF